MAMHTIPTLNHELSVQTQSAKTYFWADCLLNEAEKSLLADGETQH